jgi:hypothetical protein
MGQDCTSAQMCCNRAEANEIVTASGIYKGNLDKGTYESVRYLQTPTHPSSRLMTGAG